MIITGLTISPGFTLTPPPTSSGIIADTYFNYTTVLLSGDGTNNATNATFVDSSTNNFAITRNGNTTQGTFSPYGPNWSNYFDGTGDYLNTPTNAAFTFGTGDLTLECWIYQTATSTSTYRVIFADNVYGGTGGYTLYSYNNALNLWKGGSEVIAPAGTITLNVWTHVAWTRSGSSNRLFINGTQVGATTTDATNYTGTMSYIGASVTGTLPFAGYISNARIVKGTALYTTTFTPSTAPLTAITNTSLLTCQSNRFVDNSTNAFAITRNGDTAVQRFSPFSPTAAYSADTIGGSAYFDGTGDYLSFIGSGLGGGNFTIELWGYFTSYPNAQNALYNHGTTDGFASCILYLTSAGSLSLYNYSSAVGTSTTNVPLNTWTHMAVTRVGTTLTYYINGVASGTGTSSANISETTNKVMQGFGGITNSPIGYISNLRTVVGTAVYTANFTPPTAPVAAITNTSLLLNFTNAGIIDNTMMNNLETVGDAKISTTQSKFGGSSMYFDGTGDYLSIPNNTWMNLGTTFTIEFWFYRTLNQAMRIISRQDSSPPYNGYNISYGEVAGQWYFDASATSITFADGGLTNQWVHYAWVVNGTSGTVYRNGVSVGTATQTAQTPSTNTTLLVGAREGPTNYLGGYIDDLRITKGVARYTTTFTAPTAAFPTQ